MACGRRRDGPAVPQRRVALRGRTADTRRRAALLSAIRRPGSAADARFRPHRGMDAGARRPPGRRGRRGRASFHGFRGDARAVAACVRAPVHRHRARQDAGAATGRDQHRRGAVRVHRRAAYLPARRRRARHDGARPRRRQVSRQGAAPGRRRRDGGAARRRPAARPCLPRRAGESRGRRARPRHRHRRHRLCRHRRVEPGRAARRDARRSRADGYAHMLCVEAAAAHAPVTVAAGATWTGTQTLTAR